jgi:uncharacterized protein YbjQ (UPF0145 family)
MEKRTSTTNPLDDSLPACYVDTHGVITTTTNDVPGYRVAENLGVVFGLTFRSRNWGAGFGGVAKSVVGGELRVFTKLMYTSRNEAMDRMVGECMGR